MPSTPELFLPPLNLLLGPAGAGKTRACLDRLKSAKGKALLLVPSKPYAERLQARLQTPGGESPAAVEVFGEYLKKLARKKVACVRRSFQRVALAEAFDREIGADAYFAKMHGTPGFISALSGIIGELKLSGISPEALAAALPKASVLPEDESFTAKATEIGRLYRAYQNFLRANGLCDEEDIPVLAARAVSEAKELPAEVYVDGFYRLSRAWRDVLAALARRGARVTVTLPFEESRPLLFAAPARTKEALRNEFEITEEVLESPPVPRRPPALAHLERNLFSAGVPTAQTEHTSEPLLIYDAPNPYVEAEMVARALRREHDEHGTPWGRCAVILRTVGDYAPILSAVFYKYGVPVAIQRALPVADNPLIKTLATLCEVFLEDWPREKVIAFLKSSYTPADKIRADSLRLKARRRAVRHGRDVWARLAADLRDASGEKGDRLADLLDVMLSWDARLHGEERTAGEFTDAILELLRDLKLDHPGDPGDRGALSQARAAVQDYAEGRKLAGEGPVSFGRFFAAIKGVWGAATYTLPVDPEAVAVVEAYDARQLDVKVAAVMGLTERVFPKRVAEDPFFRDDERRALGQAGVQGLEPQFERADDERLLFYLSVSAPSEKLILSVPRSTDESDTLPSFYLDEVRALFNHVPTEVRTLADVVPRPDECVSERDTVLAACADHPQGEIHHEQVEAVAAVLGTRNRPPSPRTNGEAQEAYATLRAYSITEIETYNTCGFQHLVRYGLKLRALPDGGGPADKGVLFHAALRRAFRNKPEGSDRISTEQLGALVRQEFEACLQDQPIDAKPHIRRMMERALSDVFDGFTDREERYGAIFGFSPTFFELAFGQDEPDEDTEEVSRDYDPTSTPQPLVIDFGDGTPPGHVCGTIDRVDLAADGRTALVLDYKLGSTQEWPNLKEGKSVQVPLYLMAVEQLWGLNGAVGCYDSPRDKGRRRFVRRDATDTRPLQPIAGVEDGKLVKPLSTEEYDEMMLAVREAVRRAIRGISEGAVRPVPGEHCRFCDYGDVCRTDRVGVHDGEPLQAD
jgi:ATP-dependent helicase/nuclease subunit B